MVNFYYIIYISNMSLRNLYTTKITKTKPPVYREKWESLDLPRNSRFGKSHLDFHFNLNVSVSFIQIRLVYLITFLAIKRFFTANQREIAEY